ncbi:N-acetylglucosamine kinase [Cryptosporangium arvum]|uniref:N-acetylglucosamine kinase n=1 Tax=Cryptosporangium arvum TaxID=80871 RepID=UPI001B805C7E|nr:BadF/BadG/BcrA/BcrD ATPase family protein [Cryptosporangium arvum]
MSADGVLLAVDGGNSKTDVAVLDRDGTLLARRRGPGFSPHVLGVAGSVLAVEELARSTLSAIGLGLDPAAVAHTAAYLAGVDLARERREMLAAVTARGWSRSAVVDNDTFAVLRLGSPDGDGVAVVCGAGINCVGVSGSQVVRFPSLGTVSGDWGGGLQLGAEVMSAAARAEDGRGPATGLAAAVTAHFGVDSVLEAIEAFHFGDFPATRFGELSPVVFRSAAQGDAVAGRLVDRLAAEIADYVCASLRRLELRDRATPVVLGGGILAGGDERLLAGVVDRVRPEFPLARFVPVDEPPVIGSALLGLDHLGIAGDGVVRAAFRVAA